MHFNCKVPSRPGFWKELTAVTILFVVLGPCCSARVPKTEIWSTQTTTHVFAVRLKTTGQSEKYHNVNTTGKDESIPNLVQRVQRRMTQSKEAKWASVSLSAICILLLLSIFYSKMWKDYRGAQYYHPNLPVLTDSIPLIEVLNRRLHYSKISQQCSAVKLQEDEEQLLA